MGSSSSIIPSESSGFDCKYKLTSFKDIDSVFKNLSYTISNARSACKLIERLKQNKYEVPKGLSHMETIEYLEKRKACPGRLDMFIKVFDSSERQLTIQALQGDEQN